MIFDVAEQYSTSFGDYCYDRNLLFRGILRWRSTDAYHEREQKIKNYIKKKRAEENDGEMAIFAEVAVCKKSGADADSNEAQELVAKLQAHITANYYTCTDEILLPTSDSKRISISADRELPNFFQKR